MKLRKQSCYKLSQWQGHITVHNAQAVM